MDLQQSHYQHLDAILNRRRGEVRIIWKTEVCRLWTAGDETIRPQRRLQQLENRGIIHLLTAELCTPIGLYYSPSNSGL